MTAKIAFVPGDAGPSGYYRLIFPSEVLRKEGADAGIAKDLEDFERADILIFQRQHKRRAIAEILRWQERGKKVIIDFDDNFLHLNQGSTSRAVYTPEILADLKQLIGRADAVTVATEPLAQVYGELNPKIHIIPNCLPEKVFKLGRRATDKLIVGWQGGDSHYEDIKSIRSALAAVVKDNTELVLAGYDPGLFKNAVFRPWVRFGPSLPHYGLFDDFAVGICPLTKSSFNDCKSDLKWLEYSSLGIPSVVSAAPPYRTVEHRRTGMVARNLADWERHLRELISDRALAREIGRAAQDYVQRERTIEVNIWRWQQVFTGL